MLERPSFQQSLPEETHESSLSLAYIFGILKRRILYFIIPFVLISVVGSLITAAWPARYISQGTILVSSQEIPSDLVRPTVAALAADRIKIIQQRIMTRDNLLELAKKYQLSAGWQERMSGTELVDFIRERTIIRPMEETMQAREGGGRKDAIAFKVGFDYEKPQIAMRVANDLVTKILNEDVRSRTEFAEQTTKFLQREVKRLEAQLGMINDQIANSKQSGSAGIQADLSKFDQARALSMLRAELLVKSATYSDDHPDVRALKRKIEAFEKNPALAESIVANSTDPSAAGSATAAPATPATPAASATASPKASTTATGSATDPGTLDTLETQRIGLRAELNSATQKLSAARLGENLQRDQHSERLEVIEQPTLPDLSTKPNKPKLYGIVLGLALMAGVGLMLGTEMLDHSIRRSADLFSLVDRQLVVAIPYISTPGEDRHRKRKIIASVIISLIVLGAGITAILFFLPPLDVLFEKVVVKLLQ